MLFYTNKGGGGGANMVKLKKFGLEEYPGLPERDQ